MSKDFARIKPSLFWFYLSVFIIIFSNNNAFASQPPKKLFEAIVYTGNSPESSERFGVVSDFLKCLKENGHILSWEQSNNAWILHTTKRDALTKQTTKISWEFIFDKKMPDTVFLNRVLMGNRVLDDNIELMNNFKSCWKKQSWDTKKNIITSVKQAKDIVKNSGMAGIKENVLDCYKKANQHISKSNLKNMLLERCLSIDVTGYILDSAVKEKYKIPVADAFYENDLLIERANPILEYYSSEDFKRALSGIIGFVNNQLSVD